MKLVAFAALAGVVALAAWLASSLSGTPLVGYDDANIFFVYARNLVDGHGFVYNAGGERVEGFTSLLWVLVCAAARAMTPRFEVVLFAINVAVVSAALWQLLRLLTDWLTSFAVADRTRATLLSIGLTLAVALTPGYLIWNVVSLMDSGLWSSLLLFATVSTVHHALGRGQAHTSRTLPLLVIVLVLTRPEALLLVPVFIALSIAITIVNGSPMAAATKQHAAAVIAFVATVAALFAWRMSYFGYPFPNTYYAKTGDPLGARLAAGSTYLLDFALANPAFLFAVAAALATTIAAAIRYRDRRDDATARALLLCQGAVLILLLAGSAIPALEGGDHFGFWRMYQPVAPLVPIQAALSAAMLAARKPASRWLAPAACVVAIALALVPWRTWPSLDELSYASPAAPGGSWNTARVEIAIADDMRAIGSAFNRVFPDLKPSVGVIVAGGFAHEYRGATVDLMGLNNVAMAHAPGPRTGMRNHAAFNTDVFYTLAPDVLLLSLWSPERPDWFGFPMLSGAFDAPPHQQPEYFQRRAASMEIFNGGVMKGLLYQPRAAQMYAWASVRPAGGTEWIHAIFSRDFLKKLAERGYEIALPGTPR